LSWIFLLESQFSGRLLDHLTVIYCWDNAPMERFFRSLKSEWVPTKGYSSFNEAQTSITQYIVGYYSQHRPHQHNGGLPPNKAEAKYELVSYTVASFT
jgi:putative transposase